MRYYSIRIIKCTHFVPNAKIKKPYKPLKIMVCKALVYYSSSMVPGGLLVRSYRTLLTPFTSLMMRFMQV